MLRVSRAGPEFSLEPGSAGQRIGYRLRDGAVEVLYWPHLDQPAGVAPTAYALAGGIARFDIAYLDDARRLARSLAAARRTRAAARRAHSV